jgi:putative ABC transport system permease protein
MTSSPGGPPLLSRALLQLFLHPHDRECALSDLDEEFESRRDRDGESAARRWYRQQVWMSLLPSLRRRIGGDAVLSRRSGAASGGRPSLIQELKWAGRGIYGRGWRGVFVVALLGVTLAANAIVFAAADAFVFRTLPYRDPDSLVVIERTGRSVSDYIWPQALHAWRNHEDLFAGVHAHSAAASVWLTDAGVTETVRAAQITPGLLELLGVVPAWGRPFVQADAVKGAPPVAILGEALARRLFGDPSAALGQSFFTGRDTPTVVGVMPASFRFPSSREAIWRPLDLASWPDNSGLRNVARLAPGVTIDSAIGSVSNRQASVAQVANLRSDDGMRLRAMANAWGDLRATGVFAMLLGAAICLLLIACANIASLELAAAARRGRVYAVLTALGSSRASLIRVGLLEGAGLLAASFALAIVLTGWGLGILDAQLTAPMRDALTNTLDVDPRGLAFMITIAAATWLVTSLPSIWRVSRLSVVDGLRNDPRTMPVSRGAARSRQFLMAGQVALTTLLLAGALLYVRSYAHRAGLDKGFDATNLISIAVSPGPDAPKKGAELEREILERLRITPFVQSVSLTASPPPTTQSGTMAPLTIEGRPASAGWIMLHLKDGDPEYFSTMGIQIIQGRPFDATTRPEQIVIDERFARRFWPDGSALGARFRLGTATHSGVSVYEVIGVSREMRPDRLSNDRGEEVFVGYFRLAPTYHPLTYVARVDDELRVSDLASIVRSVAPRSLVRVNTINELYARLDADTRLAAAVTSGFGLIALIVAVGGIYAVMAFLVAGRAKEIAIRMALGADGPGVRRMVLQSSLGFVVIGAGVGAAGAVLAAQAISAQLAGITATDPTTYVTVVGLLVAASMVATWWPAMRASRIDPAITLRTE